MAITYASCIPVSDAFNEASDCSVRAIAIACDTPYKKVHAHLRSLGRINRRGTSEITIKLAVNGLGFDVRLVRGAGTALSSFGKSTRNDLRTLSARPSVTHNLIVSQVAARHCRSNNNYHHHIYGVHNNEN